MDTIKDYLLSVTAAALVCGIVNSLSGKGSTSKLLKLISGMFLAAVVIQPAVEIKLDNIYTFTDNLAVSSNIVVSQGESLAAEEMKRIIKEKTEAYILDKAKALGAEISVEITLQDYTPIGVTIEGSVSPYAKKNLSASITQELDIPPEEQLWIRS